MSKNVQITWTMTKEQGDSILTQLKALHATLPQPESGSVREFHIVPVCSGITVVLRYVKPNGETVFEYMTDILESIPTVVCTYRGPRKDFGFGDVGPFMGIHQNGAIMFTITDIEQKKAAETQAAQSAPSPEFKETMSKLDQALKDAAERKEARKPMVKKVAIGAAVLAVIAGGAYGYYRYSQQKAAKAADVGAEPFADPVI